MTGLRDLGHWVRMSANRTRGCGFTLCCLLVGTLQGCSGGDAPGRDTASRSGESSSPRTPLGAGGAAARGFGSGPENLAGLGAPTNASLPAANRGSDVCASALVNAVRSMPTIMFVIDGSGSMCAPFGNSTRWQALRTALLDPMKGLIYRLQSSVSFGATLFDGTIDFTLALTQPAGGGGNSNQNSGCALNYAGMKDMGMCPQLVEVLPPRLNNAMAVDRGAAAGIKTWVVSLAGGDAMLQAHLDEVAKHGDPTNPSARTFNPTNPDDLIMTLAQLLGGAVGCHVNLNGTVAVGQDHCRVVKRPAMDGTAISDRRRHRMVGVFRTITRSSSSAMRARAFYSARTSC